MSAVWPSTPHGYERLTADLDLVIGLEEDNILRALRVLQEAGWQVGVPLKPEEFADPARRESLRREKNMVVLPLWSNLHRRTPIDIFVSEPFDFEKELARAKWEPVAGDIPAPIVNYETLIAMKKEAGRDKDLLDIEKLRAAGWLSMTRDEVTRLCETPDWRWCTFEGAELHTLLLGLTTTFREKLQWLEEAETLTLQLRQSAPAAGRIGGRCAEIFARNPPTSDAVGSEPLAPGQRSAARGLGKLRKSSIPQGSQRRTFPPSSGWLCVPARPTDSQRRFRAHSQTGRQFARLRHDAWWPDRYCAK